MASEFGKVGSESGELPVDVGQAEAAIPWNGTNDAESATSGRCEQDIQITLAGTENCTHGCDCDDTDSEVLHGRDCVVYVAISDFVSDDPSCLNVNVGDTMVVLHRTSEDWCVESVLDTGCFLALHAFHRHRSKKRCV